MCRTNYRKIFITLNFDPVVHVIIRSVHSFTLHCFSVIRRMTFEPYQTGKIACTCTTFPCSLVEVFSIILDIEVYIMSSCYCIMMSAIIQCFVITLWLFRMAFQSLYCIIYGLYFILFQFAVGRCCVCCCTTHRCVLSY